MMRFHKVALCFLIWVATVDGFGGGSTARHYRGTWTSFLRESFFGLPNEIQQPISSSRTSGWPLSSSRLFMSFDPWGRRNRDDNGGMNVKGLQPDQIGSNAGRGNSLFPSSYTERPSPNGMNAYDAQYQQLQADQDDSVRFDSDLFGPGRAGGGRNNNNRNVTWNRGPGQQQWAGNNNNNNQRGNKNNNNQRKQQQAVRQLQLSADQVNRGDWRNSSVGTSSRSNIIYDGEEPEPLQPQYRGPATTAKSNNQNRRPSPKGVSGFFQRKNNGVKKQNNNNKRNGKKVQIFVDGINYPSDNYNVGRQLRLDQDDPFTTTRLSNNGPRYANNNGNTQQYRSTTTAKSNRSPGGFLPFGRSQQVKKQSNNKGNAIFISPPANNNNNKRVNQAQSFGPGFPANMTRSTTNINVLLSSNNTEMTVDGTLRADQDDVKTAKPLGYVEPIRVERANSRNATLGGTRAGVYQPGIGQGKVLNRGGGRYGYYPQQQPRQPQRQQQGNSYQQRQRQRLQQQQQQQQQGNRRMNNGYQQRQQGNRMGGSGYQAQAGGGGRMGGQGGYYQDGRQIPRGNNGYYNYNYQGKEGASLNRNQLDFGIPPLTPEQRRAESQRQFWNSLGAVTLATAIGVPLALQTLPPESMRDPLVKQFPQYKEQIDKVASYRWDIKLPVEYKSLSMPEYNFPTAEEVRKQMEKAGLSQDKLKDSIADGTEKLDSFLQKMNKDTGISDSFSKSADKVDSLMDKLSKNDIGKIGTAAGAAAALKSTAPPPAPSVPAAPPKLETPKAPEQKKEEVKATTPAAPPKKEEVKPAPAASPKEEVKAKEAPAATPPPKPAASAEVKAPAPAPAPPKKEEAKASETPKKAEEPPKKVEEVKAKETPPPAPKPAPAPAPAASIEPPKPKPPPVPVPATTPVAQKAPQAPTPKLDEKQRAATLKEIERIRAELAAIEEKRRALALKPVNDEVLDESEIYRPSYVGGGHERRKDEPPKFGGYDASLF